MSSFILNLSRVSAIFFVYLPVVMKPSVSIIVLFLSGVTACYAQLVPNGGFESNSGLPVTIGQWALCSAWNNAFSGASSPDYFHYDGSLGGDLPETPIAEVEAHEGRAIMGFAATGIKGSNTREYLSIKLSTALVPGQKYCLSFWYCNGDIGAFSNAGLGTSHFGAHFTEGPVVHEAIEPIELEPVFEVNNILFSREWSQLSFNFFADGPWEYLTIGVFGNDDDKEIEAFEDSSPLLSYYFLDEVKLEIVDDGTLAYQEQANRPVETPEDSGGKLPMSESRPRPASSPDEPEGFFIPNAFTPDFDGINDVFYASIPENIPFTLSVFSRWGELLFSGSSKNDVWDGRFQGKLLPPDVYVWQLNYLIPGSEGLPEERVIEGIVNLIR